MGTKGSNHFARPSVWQKSLRFSPKEAGFWVFLGLGSGLSPSLKAEPRAGVVRGLFQTFQTPLTGRANPAGCICNWKHNSHHGVFFTPAVCLYHCKVHWHIFIFIIFSPLFKLGHPRSGLSCLWDFQSTWMCRGASKGVDTLGFSWVLHFVPCCRQCVMMALFPSSLAGAGSGFLLVMSFVFTLSKFADWPVWFKSFLPHKCRILYGPTYCGLDKTFSSY